MFITLPKIAPPGLRIQIQDTAHSKGEGISTLTASIVA